MTARRDPDSRPEPPNLESLKQELLKIASIADPTERLLEVPAVIGEALSDLNIQPVVVGGLALAYWSKSDEFITGDIDVVVPRVPELPERLEALGFAQQGREWPPTCSSPMTSTPRGSNGARVRKGLPARCMNCVD